MTSITMTASTLGFPAVTNRSSIAIQRRFVINAVRAVEGEKMVRYDINKEGSNGRRELMYAAAAAAVCSVAGVAMADEDEPKRGTPEAKKKYAPVCVTNPTARICRN
ncbi:photosystem II 5 kDa protein, chloroplastic-like [Vicia villosa]|uniref:photosystem II 5 kDa protein, chloroplastic-like n=1 Tax=Vicia villosa TaxID=3911 RepID=UPI00273C45BA|nr:photosystem II 5 kDa protein, chloroplastic-like [Vicia villosa]